MSERREAMRNMDRSGRLVVRPLGTRRPHFSHACHALLRSPWWQLGAWMFLGYFIVNCAFTALYLAGGGCIQGAQASHRGNPILEARLRLIRARHHITREGEVFRQLLDLDLVRDRVR